MSGAEEDKQKEVAAQVAAALKDPDIPHIYFNGFQNALSQADILINLIRNGQSVGTLNCSYTLAKTLVAKLGSMIADLEKSSGNTIMTTTDVEQHLISGQPSSTESK